MNLSDVELLASAFEKQQNLCLQLLELNDVSLRTGDQLKIKGFILNDADRYKNDNLHV